MTRQELKEHFVPLMLIVMWVAIMGIMFAAMVFKQGSFSDDLSTGAKEEKQ